ncbi:predicted protein [Lichtheimia corymbifera JMRC:FSU:9682]|uniref:UBA domain-containing protein n=1 Tax=Lichtheimia corymbifera JMRC:FSU:9682 TaxID=1263082 RepID=A0A068RX13_9FUNG|nr:predicted protein [Lichtheimia corymbifera JMRC:FSU:9682]
MGFDPEVAREALHTFRGYMSRALDFLLARQPDAPSTASSKESLPHPPAPYPPRSYQPYPTQPIHLLHYRIPIPPRNHYPYVPLLLGNPVQIAKKTKKAQNDQEQKHCVSVDV